MKKFLFIFSFVCSSFSYAEDSTYNRFIETKLSDWKIYPLLSVGDRPIKNHYKLVGIPDGLGVTKENNSKIKIYMNHEIANGKEALYLSSADWMDRNLFRRIEVAFPVQDKNLKQRVIQEGLNELLKDKSAWIMNSNGSYKQLKNAAQSQTPSGQQHLLIKYGPETSVTKKSK